MALTPWLVMMVKAPIAGAVKTRLARDVGVAEALRFYRASTAATIRRLRADRRWRFVLSVAPDSAAMAPAWPADILRIGQGSGDLGARMQRVIDRMPPGPVIIVGSDIPTIRPTHIARAFAALGQADIVFGPSDDGGYWLVGAKRRPHVPQVFSNVRWSSEHALSDTLGNLSNYVTYQIDPLDDVDTAGDLKRWRQSG